MDICDNVYENHFFFIWPISFYFYYYYLFSFFLFFFFFSKTLLEIIQVAHFYIQQVALVLKQNLFHEISHTIHIKWLLIQKVLDCQGVSGWYASLQNPDEVLALVWVTNNLINTFHQACPVSLIPDKTLLDQVSSGKIYIKLGQKVMGR